MLERYSLVIGPVQADVARPYRVILDGNSGQLLGHAIRAPATNWLDWFGRCRETVCEAPDGSHLCSIQRDWWISDAMLRDSEGQVIAIIKRRYIVWPDQRPLAALANSSLPNQSVFLNAQNVELATLQFVGTQRRLNYHPRLTEEPFIKMALLAATLNS